MAKVGELLGGFFEYLIEGTYSAAVPIAETLGLDPFTVIILSSILISGIITSAANVKDEDIFKTSYGVGLSGAIMLHAFVTVDYMKRINGVEAGTYIGKLIGDISGTTVYLFVMFLLLSYGTIKLGSKKEFLKKFTGFNR